MWWSSQGKHCKRYCQSSACTEWAIFKMGWWCLVDCWQRQYNSESDKDFAQQDWQQQEATAGTSLCGLSGCITGTDITEQVRFCDFWNRSILQSGIDNFSLRCTYRAPEVNLQGFCSKQHIEDRYFEVCALDFRICKWWWWGLHSSCHEYKWLSWQLDHHHPWKQKH